MGCGNCELPLDEIPTPFSVIALQSFSLRSFEAKVKQSAPRAKVRLFYFDSKFRAESIRMILSAGDLPFDDRRVGLHEWKIMKQSEN